MSAMVGEEVGLIRTWTSVLDPMIVAIVKTVLVKTSVTAVVVVTV
jgi:hypothetical protein